MVTTIYNIEELESKDNLLKCANCLKNGGLVVFPTETVYGLGANALMEEAVHNIFQAKGRPSDNPLIVHISDISQLEGLVLDITEKAELVMKKFWPGPLTIVFKKTDQVPDIITGGLNTVAVRMPNHTIALELIERAGVPVAAPSANTSGKPSPTQAKHVIEDLDGKVDIIIDGGDCTVGVESTVLDLTLDIPCILRPGGITREQLEEVLGSVQVTTSIEEDVDRPTAPGMKYTHYAPKAQVIVVKGLQKNVVRKINELTNRYRSEGKKVGMISTDETKDSYIADVIISAGSRARPETIAASLFRILRQMDEEKVDIILAEAIDEAGIGMAVMNRLTKAAGGNVIKA